jgi:hypothetical protein
VSTPDFATKDGFIIVITASARAATVLIWMFIAETKPVAYSD